MRSFLLFLTCLATVATGSIVKRNDNPPNNLKSTKGATVTRVVTHHKTTVTAKHTHTKTITAYRTVTGGTKTVTQTQPGRVTTITKPGSVITITQPGSVISKPGSVTTVTKACSATTIRVPGPTVTNIVTHPITVPVPTTVTITGGVTTVTVSTTVSLPGEVTTVTVPTTVNLPGVVTTVTTVQTVVPVPVTTTTTVTLRDATTVTVSICASATITPLPTVIPREVPPFTFLACTNNGGAQLALSGPTSISATLTPASCATECAGFVYFGVSNGDTCTCGNVLNPRSNEPNENACNIPCSGNPTQFCGANAHIQVYVRPA